MAKSLYREKMSNLLIAAKKAEKDYQKYLIDTFSLTSKYTLKEIATLPQCLDKVLGESDRDAKYKEQLGKFSDKLNNQAIDEVTSAVYKMMTGPRLDRTLELLGKEITREGKLQTKGRGKKELLDVDISMIVGNVKEHYFKIAGEKQVKEASKNGMFKAVLKDIDNRKMDFLIQEEGVTTRYSSSRAKEGFTHIINGVPLEYKSSFNPMHLTSKNIALKDTIGYADQLIRHHIGVGNNFNKMIEDLELDVCRMVVIEKIARGFPVFVASSAGTTGKQYILCSDMLKDLSTIAKIKSTMLNQPKTITGFESLKTGVTLDDIRKVIKEDADLRAQIEHQLSSLEHQVGEEGMTAEMYKTKNSLQRDLAAANILKKLCGNSVKTDLWYGK